MARPADGKLAKDRSRTGLFAHLTARLEKHAYLQHSAFFRDQLRINISGKSARDAADFWLDQAAPPTTEPVALDRGDSVRNWLLMDEPRLDLDVAMLRFAGRGEPQPQVRDALAGIPGVRQIFQLSGQGDVLAVLLFRGARARRELREMIDDRVPASGSWNEIEFETSEPALATWRWLTTRAARDEGLLLPPPADTQPTQSSSAAGD